MNRLLGILLMVVVLYGVLMATDPNARSLENQRTIASRLGFYGVLTLGIGVLIISGGIDLSIGSVVGLVAVLFGLMLEREVPPWRAALAVLALSAVIGLVHGLLITRLRLQPFLVTLCGLFVYRGVARWAAPKSVGLGTDASIPYKATVETIREWLVLHPFGVPQQLLLLLLLAVLIGLFLHGTRHGRYLFAIGANEDAARYAGIATDRYKVLAYILCSLLAGIGGVLFILESHSVIATNAGNLLELFAITGAVLGGCSLRGGEGTVPGMLLGAAVLPLLRQLVNFGDIATELEYVVIGSALLLGTIADELLKRRAARRK